jgi:hypothetical protein
MASAIRRRDPEALVFTAPLGGPLRPHTWLKSFFKPAVRAAGLPEGYGCTTCGTPVRRC